MFDEAFDRAPVPQVVFDRYGRVTHANVQFRRLFGPSVGQVIDDLLSSASPGLLRLVSALLTERHAFDVKDIVIRLEGARQMSVEAYGTSLDSDKFFLVGLVDFTERVTQATSRAQRERSETIARFAGGLAHDLNNLLAAIVATAQAGSGDAADGVGDAASDFTAIIEEAERGAALARSLRAIAFDETGSWRPVSLASEVRAAAAVLARGSTAVPIVLDIASDTPDVVGDRARLHQLVLNLLVNARDATRLHAGGIEVALGPAPGGGVDLVVSDHGPGVPADLRERIFQPYFTTKRRAGDAENGGWGTGLGLPIVDAVARSTGAEITVGDRVGGGAEFRIRWPATAVVRENAPLPRELVAEVSPALVLLADNEVALVGAVARQLRRLGHSVYAAMSAAECRRLFEQYRDSIDVAVLDVKLGDGDGRELAELFREQRPDLGIVLMSASRSVLGSSNPNTRALVKPFDVRELTLAIERARAGARQQVHPPGP
ncbi:MAG TPA: hybrid sensor histidine kinase/response regulator [Polyangiaceae bacterium]|nr:hybrid sensor histidine kinase/response regulator [Polyangiaceae bacterium]